MGDLLLNWLNDEIQLSKRITNFEEDFHNGYLFGQLLAKYSQQLNFHEFINKDDKASRIKNFSLLLDTFSALKVTYDSNIAMNIINRQWGVAKKLLYELKTQLQKTNANAFSKTNRMSRTLSPLKKIQISKQKFDNVNREHFLKQLNEMHPAQKEIVQDRLLKKFGDFHERTLNKVVQEEEKERQAKQLLRNKFHDQQRENLKKSQEFREQWESSNLQKWAVNMTIRQAQVSKDQQFRSKINYEKTHNKTMSQMNALKSLKNDIAEFERKNLGKSQDDSDQEPAEIKPMTKKVTSSLERTDPGLLRPRDDVRQERRLGAAETQKKRHQRQKRRRKMIVQQQKRYQMIQITRRQRCIISTIEQISRQEKEIQYQIWRAWENKNIIIENKNVYAEKIKQKEQVRDINAKFKRDELLKVYREEHREQVNQALNESTQLHRRHQVSGRKDVYKVCQNMIGELLEVTESMYISSQERNKGQIDGNELEAALIRFVQGTKTAQHENTLRLKHYISGTNQWGMKVTRPEEEVPTDPKEDNALPNQTVNNYYLGNILRNIFESLYKQSIQNQEKASGQKLLISLVGLDYARKHYLAESIRSKKNFNIIYVDKLIQARLEDYNNLKAKQVQISQETKELAQHCFNGTQVPDQLIIRLIAAQYQKSTHSILVDYPNTYEQSIALCKELGKVQPHDMLITSKLAKKIKEYSRLVKGTQSKIVQRRVRQCGIDFVWWVDVTAENALDRMLGRRWIGTQEVHINDDVEPQPLKQGEKAAALVMNNHFKAKNKDKIKQWFELFGTEFGSEEATSRKCWEEIDGNCDKESLQWTVGAKIDEILALKKKQQQWNTALEEEKKKKQEQQTNQEKVKEDLKAKCVKSSPEAVKEQLSLALGKIGLNRQFLQQLGQLWNRIQASTVNSLSRAFQTLSQQQRNQRKYIAQTKRVFIALLTREDHKFLLIKEFQSNYNSFITQNEDMLVYDYTKEELHQRVQDLENDLLEVVDQKKEDAITQRNGIIGSGWLEGQYQIINEALFVLIQTQLNRFALSEKLINDYYGKKFMTNNKTYEPLNPQLNTETISSQEIYKDGVCPRLDKMISQAYRILNRQEEVTDDKNKKGGKGAPPKKDDKKGAKKGGKEEVEESKQPTAEELELKKAVNTQKAILRQRLNKIKTLGTSKLRNAHESAQKLYSELEDLYIYTDKVQKKAIFGLAKIFRKSIEAEQKIESEVQIHHVAVTQTDHIRNYQKEKPVIIPARQNISSSHFNLSNLHQIIKLIRQEAGGNKMSTKKLIILLKKIMSHLQLKKLLPQTWKAVSSEQIQSFVSLLDYNNKAYVDLVNIFLFMIMSGYSLPSEEQIQQYNLDLTNYSSLKQTSLDKFVAAKAWFEEQIPQKENVRPFLRNKYIKELLFEVFKNKGDDNLDIGAFINAVALKDYQKVKEVKEEWTYYDFAFS